MGIIGDILDAAMDAGRQGVIISTVSRRANLSHYAALDKCNKLIAAGLLESERNKTNRIYTLTEKGLEFVPEIRRFRQLLDSMNLRC